MFYEMKTEADRIPTCEKYIREIMKELDRQIFECDYIEDVNGDRVYAPGSYSYEKRDYLRQRGQWEKLLNMLTDAAPHTFID